MALPENHATEELLRYAEKVLGGSRHPAEEILAAARSLAARQHLDYARRLAARIDAAGELDARQAVALRQQWALWTSKNPDAPVDTRHDEALRILDDIGHLPGGEALADTVDPETLGIAGGICKRQWMWDGLLQTLERSLQYYRRGHARGVAADNGYNAINAAFVLDLLASLRQGEATVLAAEARDLRREVLEGLVPVENEPTRAGGPARGGERWFHETLAEAHFGLGEYEAAVARLRQAYPDGPSGVEPWEYEATARQFAWLARLHAAQAGAGDGFEDSAPWLALREAFADHVGAGSLFAGKLGLALSGGGFRASLFHVGVLAALAERDLLRHVEVLSCVSGGSILGAHYYLEVRELLHSTRDEDITRQHYIDIVERLARDFLAGVQENLRIRLGANLVDNLRIMFQPGYTETSRLGELYERHLYARVRDDGKRRLRELQVRPRGDEGCQPKYDNWRRRNKVPILILNATSLNTGHNWQFTTSWMGEPPAFIDQEIDANYRLRRMYLEREAPAPHRDIHLGQAVAASACVPGLFSPLELRGLYPDVTVRLVDGGVHDNQGLFGLLDQDCAVMLVSDASGQSASVDIPSDSRLNVLLRTTGILQARVRSAVYREVESRRRSGRIKGLGFLHLKKDLVAEDRDWIGCNNPKELSSQALARQRQALTGYGILKSLQEKLAGLRTDLDSFSQTEAWALMTSGCAMARVHLRDPVRDFPAQGGEHPWSFLAIKPLLERPDPTVLERVDRLLRAGGQTLFKVWRLWPPLRVAAWILLAALAAVLLFGVVHWRGEPVLSPKGIVAAVAMVMMGMAAARLGLGFLVKLIGFRKTLRQILLGGALCTLGWAATLVHVRWLDKVFLAIGRLAPPTSPKEDP